MQISRRSVPRAALITCTVPAFYKPVYFGDHASVARCLSRYSQNARAPGTAIRLQLAIERPSRLRSQLAVCTRSSCNLSSWQSGQHAAEAVGVEFCTYSMLLSGVRIAPFQCGRRFLRRSSLCMFFFFFFLSYSPRAARPVCLNCSPIVFTRCAFDSMRKECMAKCRRLIYTLILHRLRSKASSEYAEV